MKPNVLTEKTIKVIETLPESTHEYWKTVLIRWKNGASEPEFKSRDLRVVWFYLKVIELSSYICSKEGLYDIKAAKMLRRTLNNGSVIFQNSDHNMAKGIYHDKVGD